MIAVAIREPGPPDVLVPVERPLPSPGPQELLIKVAAAGVNRPDIFQRLGRYSIPPGVTDIPGLEVSGIVAAVGTGDVRGWSVGDRICALVAGGGYAEYCVAPAPQCLPIPVGLDVLQAAALPEVMFTVWTNVFELGQLKAGESILIHGGSSGIGTAAIQLARARGARVFATAGTDEKCAACEGLGAERCINYRTADFVSSIRTSTADRGVDVVLDMVGGEYMQRNIDVLAMEGRLVQIAQLGGRRATLDTSPILQRRLTITGSLLRPRSVEEKGRIAVAVREQVWPLIGSGAVRVLIHASFPLVRAADAHRMMEASTHVGKLILQVQSSDSAV
jgi:NADPH:quinone reductase